MKWMNQDTHLYNYIDHLNSLSKHLTFRFCYSNTAKTSRGVEYRNKETSEWVTLIKPTTRGQLLKELERLKERKTK
jgi:hypothetical protein